MERKILLMLAAAFLLIFAACKKKNPEPEPDPEPDWSSVSDNSTAEAAFDDAFSMTLDGAGQKDRLKNSCADVTLDTSAVPDKLTIDFGAGCTGTDGRTRAGKIVATFTGRYRDSGTVIVITPDGYSVDGHKVSGTKTVTHMGTRNGGHPYYKIEVRNGQVITAAGDTLTWESDREREWSEGYNTPADIFDDVYLISGTMSGTNRAGKGYLAETKSALMVLIGCRHVVSGVLDITPDGLPVRSIDYGSGNCDGDVAVTVSGRKYNITVK